ncbi:MAG: hypothetical protein ACOCYB_08980 [Alkalispirochaeta sp.]
MFKEALSEATVRRDVDVAHGEAATDAILNLICGSSAFSASRSPAPQWSGGPEFSFSSPSLSPWASLSGIG